MHTYTSILITAAIVAVVVLGAAKEGFKRPAARPSPKPAARPSPKPAARPSPKPAARPSPKPVPRPSPKPASKPGRTSSPGCPSGQVWDGKKCRKPSGVPKATVKTMFAARSLSSASPAAATTESAPAPADLATGLPGYTAQPYDAAFWAASRQRVADKQQKLGMTRGMLNYNSPAYQEMVIRDNGGPVQAPEQYEYGTYDGETAYDGPQIVTDFSYLGLGPNLAAGV